MTVGPRQEWGAVVDVAPPDLTPVTTDAAVAASIGARPVLVRGGDLHRTVGEPSGAVTRRLPIDVIAVTVDGVAHDAVAHVVARRPGTIGWWRGPVAGVFNVEYLGRWDAVPRAHPNDGRLDIVELDPSTTLRQRWQMRARLPSGTHLPHPALRTRRAASAQLVFGEPLEVAVDGVVVGTAEMVDVEIRPDAACVYV